MKTAARGRAATLASLGLSLALAACGSGTDSGGGGSPRSVDVALTDEGCDPAKLNRPAGPVTFKVTNKGTDKVTEFEVTDGDRILGEVENVTAGLERSFSLNLTAGSYTMKCPGGSGASQGTLTVSGDRAAGAGGDADLVAAAERYQGYLEDQVGLLRASTRTFVDAGLRPGAPPLRADRAGCREFRRPRSGHRRARRRRPGRAVGRVPPDRAGAVGRELHHGHAAGRPQAARRRD